MRRLLVLALAALAVSAPSAGAVTFGANLNRAPDVTTTCGDFNALFPGYDPRLFDSCSLTFQNLRTGETVFPPAGQGTVTQVRVRVGPNTGPMQVVVEQALRKDNPGDPGHPTYACCQAIRVSQAFTPAANSVTTVPVNLPVRQDLAPDPSTGYYVDQHLALSVLARNVPIPGSTDSNTFYSAWFPAWRAGDERTGPYNGSGAIVLFNAEWQAAGGGGGGAGGGGGDVPGIDFGRVRALRDGTARLPITLPGPGRLGITDDRARAAAKRKPKARVKRIRRTIKKAGTVVVRIRPSKPGRRTLRRKHKLKVKLRVTFTPAGAKSSAVTTKSLTLKLKRRRR